jgi:hypothetical protein
MNRRQSHDNGSYLESYFAGNKIIRKEVLVNVITPVAILMLAHAHGVAELGGG